MSFYTESTGWCGVDFGSREKLQIFKVRIIWKLSFFVSKRTVRN